MNIQALLNRSVAPAARCVTRSTSQRFRLGLVAAAIVLPGASQALEYGPFSLNGFAKVEVQRGSNHCPDCQVFPNEDKQRYWADELVPGAPFHTTNTHVTLIQPYLGAKFDIGGGFKLSGLLSQRWRDGSPDIPGFWYDKNVAVSHDDYGSLRVGSMTTRTWSVADYPYGTNIGLADEWGSSGAGYGLLAHAIRYTARPLDVFDGDLVLEATYDQGNRDFKRNKPSFWEFYAQYHRGDLVVDAMYQDTRNGTPSAWSHGPFTGLTPFSEDDGKLGGSGQSIAMAMARYQVDAKLEVSGGIRRNRWSGAYAVITKFTSFAQWNNMFNVDWTNDLGGGVYKGYSSTSVDVMGGARYRMGKWVASAGVARLGKGSTDNPSARAKDMNSNTATVGSLGLNYEFGNGFQVYGMAGMVHYGHLGLSPISMPGNAAFTNVDSRVTQNGNWVGLGAVYAF